MGTRTCAKVLDKILAFVASFATWKRAVRFRQQESTDMSGTPNLIPAANWQTRARGSNDQEYQIYLACADDGKGGDITRGGAPLKTYDEWLAS